MSKQFRKINWDKKLYKRAVKDYNKLAVFYADVSLSRDAWEKWSDMWEEKYYKLLKKYKAVKNKLKVYEAELDKVSVRFDIASEDVLNRKWEKKAWECLRDSSSEVKE